MKKIVCIIFLIALLSGCASTDSVIIKAAKSGDVATLRTLHASGNSINETDRSGMTPLMYSISKKKPDAAKYLIESGADIKVRDSSGSDALIWAVYYDELEIIKLLLDTGADIESKDNSGMTPLVHAVWQVGNLNTVNLLIKRGANVNSRDANGQSVLDFALSMKAKTDIVDELLNAGAKLWEPENGKARLLFIGEEFFLGDTLVTVGDINKNLNKDKIAFVDLDPGNYTITISASWYETIPTRPVSVKAGQTYYFTLTPTTSRKVSRVLGFGLFPAVIADKAGGTGPVAITPIDESIAKEKIKALLKTNN
jgi:hypothetical protein